MSTPWPTLAHSCYLLPPAPRPQTLSLFHPYLIITLSYICDSYLGFFFGATKFLVTFAIFADLRSWLKYRRFLQAVSIVCNPCWICYFCYICDFFYTFLTCTVHLINILFFLPKLPKQFATKFLRQYSILDISEEPQDSIRQLFQPL